MKRFDEKRDWDACASVNYLTFHCLRLQLVISD